MKKVCIAILLLLICLALCSCAKDPAGFEELFSYTETEESSVEPFAKNIYVVIPQNSSAVLSSRTSALANDIQSKTGVTCTVKYDNEELITDQNNLEILVGRTNRIISRESTEKLKLGEYVCRWDRGSIVLGGRDETATILSIDAFCDKILSGASNASLMNENVHLENKCNFDVKNATVNGYDLYDFTLTYGNNDFERDITFMLRDYIADISGYYLDVSSYKSLGTSRKKVISLGDSLADEQSKELYSAFVDKSGEDIVLYGRDSYGLSAAAHAFATRLVLNDDGNMSADILKAIPANGINKELRVCSIISDGAATLDYIGKLSDKLEQADADVVLLGEIKAELLQLISINLEEKYNYSSVEMSNGYVFLTLYNTQSVDSLECKAGNEGFKIVVKDKSKNIFSIMLSLSGLLGNDSYASDIVILLDGNTADKLKDRGFSLLDSHTASLGQEKYTRLIYTNANNLTVVGEPDRSSVATENTLNSFIAFDVKLKYSSQFRELAYTLD